MFFLPSIAFNLYSTTVAWKLGRGGERERERDRKRMEGARELLKRVGKGEGGEKEREKERERERLM